MKTISTEIGLLIREGIVLFSPLPKFNVINYWIFKTLLNTFQVENLFGELKISQG